MRPIHILLLSVVACFSLGVFATIGSILLDDEPMWEFVSTIFFLGLMGLAALGCSFVLLRGVWRVGMWFGFGFLAAATLLVLDQIWLETIASTWGWGVPEFLIGLTVTWALVIPVAGLIALTRFNNWMRWVRFVTLTMVLLAASMATVAMTIGFHDAYWWAADFFARGMLIVVLLALLGVVTTPVLYLIAGTPARPPVESTPTEMNIECPRCLLRQTVAEGESRCRGCRLKFTIEIEEPRCPTCGYLLYRLQSPRCPECGEALAAEELGPDMAAQQPAAIGDEGR